MENSNRVDRVDGANENLVAVGPESTSRRNRLSTGSTRLVLIAIAAALAGAAGGCSGCDDSGKQPRVLGDMELELSMKRYVEQGDFRSAAMIYDDNGDEAKANEMWLKHAEQAEREGRFSEAIFGYARAGNTTKVQEIRLKLAKAWEANGWFDAAADAYERAGDTVKAQEMRSKAPRGL